MRKKGNRNIVSEERLFFRYARWPALPGGFIRVGRLIEPRRYGLSLGIPFFLTEQVSNPFFMRRAFFWRECLQIDNL